MITRIHNNSVLVFLQPCPWDGGHSSVGVSSCFNSNWLPLLQLIRTSVVHYQCFFLFLRLTIMVCVRQHRDITHLFVGAQSARAPLHEYLKPDMALQRVEKYPTTITSKGSARGSELCLLMSEPEPSLQNLLITAGYILGQQDK